jgi:uncharacterized phage protein (TIGR01671 family)
MSEQTERTIKFRGRHESGQWCYGFLVRTQGQLLIWQEETEQTSVSLVVVDPVTVGQFTGLMDRNGKEIYEGDIVKFKEEDRYSTGEVVFGKHNGAFCFRLPELGIRTPMLNFMSTLSLAATYDFEITGNIHEKEQP